MTKTVKQCTFSTESQVIICITNHVKYFSQAKELGIKNSPLYIACTNPCVSENILSCDLKLENLMSLISSDH